MYLRYRAGLVLTSLLVASAAAGWAKPVHQHRLRADEIYSRRALLRARVILQLKLLELRSERLERVRKAIERRIPIDQLLKDF